MIVRFLHAWHSVPDGVKPTYLAQHGHEVINSTEAAGRGEPQASRIILLVRIAPGQEENHGPKADLWRTLEYRPPPGHSFRHINPGDDNSDQQKSQGQESDKLAVTIQVRRRQQAQ